MGESVGDYYDHKSSAEHRAYYEAWAETYDEDFAARESYDYPARVAAILAAVSVAADSPIADVGCGTGLVGRALAALLPGMSIEGLDISPAMMQVASVIGCYRALHEADLSEGFGKLNGHFGAVISTGTFTLGHLGPEALRPTIELGRPSALFVIGINRQHFLEQGFAEELAALAASGLISEYDVLPVPIFGEPLPQDDIRTGNVVVFRRAA